MTIKEGKGKEVRNAKDVARIFSAILKAEEGLDREKEHLWEMMLNTRNVVKEIHLISLGTMNANILHPREVFRPAIASGASGIIISHNHPSGNATPSEEDIEITHRLHKAGEIIGIEILDNVIIGAGGKYYSFADEGLIKKGMG